HGFTQRLRLISRFRDQPIQLFAGVAKFICKLIKFFERGLVGSGSPLFKPDLTERSRKSRLFLGLSSNDVHVFEAGLPVQTQVRESLSEKSEAFAKQKNCDQRKHHNRDEGVAAKKCLDCGFSAYAPARGALFRQNRQTWRHRFHSSDDAKGLREQQSI